MSQDTSAGDATPELTDASLIQAVTFLNRIGYNLEIPVSAATVGPMVARRNLTIFPFLGSGSVPQQTNAFGAQFTLTHARVRTTLLQQSVNTDDERIYLLNNASPTPGATFQGTFVADKANASSSYYLQKTGTHEFGVAGPASAVDSAISFTVVATMTSSAVVINTTLNVNKTSSGNTQLASFGDTTNSSSLSIDSVGATNAYVQGSATGDTVIRTELGNLAIGAVAGNVVIGSSTKAYARYTTDQKVLFPGVNNVLSNYASLTVGGGIVGIVGNGSDTADANKSLWLYKNGLTNDYNAIGFQLNASNGADFWVGNTTSTWIRPFQLQTSGKALFGGVQGATAIGDIHINQISADVSGCLSLTGGGGASYMLMGNRDSGGTAGPAVIASSNRQIQFGVGDSFNSRSGGTFTQYAVIGNGSFGVGIANPSTYGPLAVNVSNGASIGQVVMALNSTTTVTSGTACGGWGMYWGNNVFIGNRAISAGDANNAGLGFYVGTAGASSLAGYFDTSNSLIVKGTTLSMGASTVPVLASNAATDTYLRGGTINLQNAAGTITWMTVSSTLIQTGLNVNIPGDLSVGSTLTTARQVEITVDKTIGSGVVAFDYNTASVWQCNGPTANFTANFTNVPTTNNRAITVSLIVGQGSTAYVPNAVQIGGVATTVRWAGGVAPVGTPSGVDVFTFTMIRTSGGSWAVIASATPYT